MPYARRRYTRKRVFSRRKPAFRNRSRYIKRRSKPSYKRRSSKSIWTTSKIGRMLSRAKIPTAATQARHDKLVKAVAYWKNLAQANGANEEVKE